MAKVELRGWFQEIGTPQEVGNNGAKSQKIIFIVPGYVDRMRDTQEPDEVWQIEVFGKYVQEFNLRQDTHENIRAKITVYVNGYSAEGKNGMFYGYRVKLAKMEILNVAA